MIRTILARMEGGDDWRRRNQAQVMPCGLGRCGALGCPAEAGGALYSTELSLETG